MFFGDTDSMADRADLRISRRYLGQIGMVPLRCVERCGSGGLQGPQDPNGARHLAGVSKCTMALCEVAPGSLMARLRSQRTQQQSARERINGEAASLQVAISQSQ